MPCCALKHKKDKQRPIAFYSAVKYTRKQLRYAERKAKKWIDSKANTTHFNKDTVIKVFGQAIADRIYQDQRTIAKRKTAIDKLIGDTAEQLVKENGYTTRDKALQAATKKHYEQLLITMQEKAENTLQMVVESDAYHKATNDVVKAWESNSKDILVNSNLVHRRPTNIEKEKLRLQGNGWIITAKCS